MRDLSDLNQARFEQGFERLLVLYRNWKKAEEVVPQNAHREVGAYNRFMSALDMFTIMSGEVSATTMSYLEDEVS
jgi:hypothetical protein